MTYFCDSCGFLFSRVGDVFGCPFCDGQRIRPATEEEAEHLRAKLKEEIAQKMRLTGEKPLGALSEEP